MLAYSSQPIHLPPSPSPSHTSHSTYFNNLPYTSCTPSPAEFNEKAIRSYLEANPSLSSNQLAFFGDSEPSLPSSSFANNNNNSSFNLQKPAIRIQSSTPTPQLSNYSNSPVLASSNNVNLNNWNMFAQSGGHLAASPSLHAPMMRKRSRGHQRDTSSSSTGSAGSAAQYSTTYPTYSNHLPTPTQTPTQDSFVSTAYPYSSQSAGLDSSIAAHMVLKQALLDQSSTGEEDLPGFGHSARQSVSSYGQDSPATPHTALDENDDKFHAGSNDVVRHTVPKFNRTITDVFQDELYNPANVAHIPSSQPTQASNNMTLLSPYRNVMSERLQAANQARSLSPASSISRGVSPFRQNSEHAPMFDGFGSSQAKFGVVNSSSQRGQSQSQMTKAQEAEPKTISPQEAMLDYNPSEADSQMSLFSDAGSSDYDAQFNGATHGPTNGGVAQSGIVSSGPAPPQANFTFAAPSVPGAFRGLPQFPTSQAYRPVSSISTLPEPTPDFPAHLTSMESSASEAGPPDSSSQSSDLQKPASTNADTGTYTCTYHGCTLRFETPQKLQRHKREGHRNAATTTTSASPGIGSGMSSAALLARNSQAGPHKCERINPTTGKPCNTIFSRPYDLTRHEDTIHNIRKQKVRCALCVEEKTFSRNDALTRHMRVVHPEVDFPGKHRRRGGNHD